MSILNASYNGNLSLLKSLTENGGDINIKDKNGNNALMLACYGTGNIETVKWILDQGISPEHKNNIGDTAFLYTAEKGHSSLLKFFKENNVDINAIGPGGYNALHRACIGTGEINSIKWLVDQGFSPEQKSTSGHHAFLLAAQKGHLLVLQLFKEINVDIQGTCPTGCNALHKACIGTGDIETIKWLLNQGLSPELRNNRGYTAFLLAAEYGHLSVLKFFKEINVDITATNPVGYNALHTACDGKGDIDTIQWLVAQGVSPEGKTADGRNPFLFAAHKGHVSVLKFFKEINVDVNVIDSLGYNAMLAACLGTGDISTIKWLVDQGFSPEHKSNDNFNTFHLASHQGNLSLLKFFKEINVDIKGTDPFGYNALHTACMGKGDVETIKWLLDQGFSADNKAKDGYNAVLLAAEKGNLSALKFFKEQNVDINVIGPARQNALHRACMGTRDMYTIKWLVDQGFSVFHWAAEMGYLSLLKYFKEINVDITGTGHLGRNALHKACIGKGDIDTIKWLVDQGFSPEDKASDGHNAILFAAQNGHLSVLKFFKEINVDIKGTGLIGRNALHAACFGKGDINTIKWLVDQGFSPDHKSGDGINAVLLAAEYGHLTVLKFFKEINADIKVIGPQAENALHMFPYR